MLIVTVLSSSDASACSCASGLMEASPEDGATGVALDAAPALVYLDPPKGPASLHDLATGDEIPVTLEQEPQGDWVVVRIVPNEPLVPLHDYSIDAPPSYGAVQTPITFTTGEDADAGAPDAVDLLGVDESRPRLLPRGRSSCGDALYLLPHLGPVPADAFYETQVAWTEDFSGAATVSGTRPDEIMLGQNGCGDTVSRLQRGDEVWVRARWTCPATRGRGATTYT